MKNINFIYQLMILMLYMMTSVNCSREKVPVPIEKGKPTPVINYHPRAGIQVKDGDGNLYNTDTIGTQVWMRENLRTTKYLSPAGKSITKVEDDSVWSHPNAAMNSKGAYCWYNNDSVTYSKLYGALYSFRAVVPTTTTYKVCPTGYRIPTSTDWDKLANFLGGSFVAGGKLKAVVPDITEAPGVPNVVVIPPSSSLATDSWHAPNTGASNVSGFTALPGGFRSYGEFAQAGTYGYWWSNDANNNTRILGYATEEIVSTKYATFYGFSVRCVK